MKARTKYRSTTWGPRDRERGDPEGLIGLFLKWPLNDNVWKCSHINTQNPYIGYVTTLSSVDLHLIRTASDVNTAE